MMKSGNEMHFEQITQNLEKQLQILGQRVSKIQKLDKLTIHNDTYSQLLSKIKTLRNIYSKIDVDTKIQIKNKNYNQYDLKEKLIRYQKTKQKLEEKYEDIGRQLQTIKRNLLFDKRGSSMRGSEAAKMQIEMKNRTKVNAILQTYKDADNDLDETNQITGNINVELGHQREVIDEMGVDARQAQVQLSMADQIMRILKNRNLITKVLFICLIVFMFIADILLVIVKVF